MLSTDQTPGQNDNRDERPPIYREGGKTIFRAHAIGLCDEALIALRMGMTPMLPPAWFREKLDEGTAWEGHIVNGALEHLGDGYRLMSTQELIELPVGNEILVRGHTDGRAGSAVHEVGIEAKKLGPSLLRSWDAGLDSFWNACPYYRDQLTLYMHVQQIPYLFTVGRWDPEKEEVTSVEVRSIDSPPGDINKIVAKVLNVEARARKGDLGDCDGKKSWPCPVYFLHVDEEREEAGDDEAEIEALAASYREAVDAEKMAKETKKQATEKLLEVMRRRGHVMENGDGSIEVDGTKLTVPGFNVTPYVHTSRWVDRGMLKAAGLDPDDFMAEKKQALVRVTATKE